MIKETIMAWNDGLEGNALEIASSNNTPIRVIAGPGTGKTYALMRRIARLLEEGTNPEDILLVTFTRVAAADLENEINELNIAGAEDVKKGTLHSFCFSVLNKAEVLTFTGRVPRPLLGFEERFLLEDLGVDDENGFGNYYDRKDMLKAFEAAWAREQHQEPGWPHDDTDRSFQLVLSEWLLFHRCMLLGEIIPETLRYLRNNPGCQERRSFSHVLVDEYQDLNRAEQNLIDLLSEHGSLTVIGDEDQSIYEKFRYAHPEGISRFDESHANTHNIPLDECRRCPTNVVNIATELIRNNRRRIGHDFDPRPDNPEGEIHIVQWQNIDEESQGISRFVAEKINSGEFDIGEVLILCPRRQFGYKIRDLLVDRGFPAHSFFYEEAFDGNPKIDGENNAQESFTLLTLIANPDDRVALRCWLGFGSSTLRAKSYNRLQDHCSISGQSPRETLQEVIDGELRIPYITTLVERFELLNNILDDLEGRSDEEKFNQLFPEGEDWSKPFRDIVEDGIDDWSPGFVLDKLRTNITQPELPSDVDYIRIMSLHKSKGLSANHVIVTGFIEGIIPTIPNDLPHEIHMRHIEEQRRLFFVAITRPRETLVLSSVLRIRRSLAYQIGANVQGGDAEYANTIASRFLYELGPTSPQPINGDEWQY
jgi:superfamily I DNA/RNA helicase